VQKGTACLLSRSHDGVYGAKKSSRPGQPEKAQIAVAGAKRPHRNLRIENILTDEHGDDVKLKKGAHVEVTVTDESYTSTTK
jgi:hypothetical protein